MHSHTSIQTYIIGMIDFILGIVGLMENIDITIRLISALGVIIATIYLVIKYKAETDLLRIKKEKELIEIQKLKEND